MMDIDLIESTGNLRIVGAELAVSTLLSSLVRRNICPNFVNTRGVFTCAFPPPVSHWGDENNKAPKGKQVSGVEWSGVEWSGVEWRHIIVGWNYSFQLNH